MYKKEIVILFVIGIFLFSFPCSYAQQGGSESDTVFIIEKVTQQTEVQIQREVGKAKEDINKNMDDNIQVLDGRLHSMLSSLTKKLIFGLIGGFTVLLVGYAWLINYITRKYTPIYQRNLLKKKMEKAVQEGRVVVDEPVGTHEDRVMEQMVAEDTLQSTPMGLLSLFKPKPTAVAATASEPELSFDYAIEGPFDYSIDSKKPVAVSSLKKSGSTLKYALLVFGAILITSGIAYLVLDINVIELLLRLVSFIRMRGGG